MRPKVSFKLFWKVWPKTGFFHWLSVCVCVCVVDWYNLVYFLLRVDLPR